MKIVLQSRDILVIDGFLPRPRFLRLNRYFTREASFEFINATRFDSVWSLNDGHPLNSPAAVIFEPDGKGGVKQVPKRRNLDHFTYPSGCALDLLIAALARDFRRFRSVVGKAGHVGRAPQDAAAHALRAIENLKERGDGQQRCGHGNRWCIRGEETRDRFRKNREEERKDRRDGGANAQRRVRCEPGARVIASANGLTHTRTRGGSAGIAS